ncbi:MAG: tandem-95 repeat protein, partial [Gammaproteobacteria bacterium]|nr:tandem-95 repeat protein [Gammaproteobacteria bacterium]
MDHQVDGIRPMITKLEITSKPTHNNTYARNESIIVKVDFDDTVYITGTPSLMLRVGDTIRAAPLLAGNRTSVLRFGYRVQIGDVDADGISVDKNSLAAFQGALRDETGNIALLTHAELGAQAGHKVNVPSNNAPEFAADAITTRTVSEDADVGTLIGAPFTATDADSNDPTTYTIAGTDAHRFDINSVGQISLGAAAMLDYERAPSLRVTVIATDTIGASAEIAVVIEVADVDSEAPLAPGAPTVTATGADSLVVSWVPPANHGPAIIGYDIEYCLKSATECTEWTAHTSTGMSTNVTITGLLSDTAYDVHVRARNAEGIGDWSATGSGSTSSATNQAPTSVDFIATTSEDTAYVFSTADFVFIDTDQPDALSGVRLITIPDDATGQLELDEVVVTKNQLIAENKLSSLSFVPALNWNGETEFTFKVVDSKNTESASANTATIRVASVNDLPVFPVAATVWEVVENSAEGDAVGEPVTATDPDGDALRYALILPTSIPLTIDPRSGQVKLGANAVLDFEQQVTYFETITASDGEVTAQLLVTIKVLDQDNEAPGQPAAPTTKVVNAASLQVEWEPPATNTGPPLIDYDIRYRKQSATAWSEQQHAGIGTSTVITDLEKDADYDIQVRAKNVEGVSNWSDSGQGRPVNQVPTSEDISFNTPTSTNITSFAAADFPFHDVDPGDAMKAVRFTSLPSSGSLVLNRDPLFPGITVNQEVEVASLSILQYWVPPAHVGRVTFQFQVIDGSDASSASYTATISVGNVNQPPVSAPFLKLAVEDTEQSFMSEDFPFRDPDAADTLASVKFVSLPASEKGALMLGATAVTVDQVVAADDIDQLKFDPVANFAGEATFSFSVADPAGNVSKVHVATIQVAGVNDVPTTSAFSKFLDEDTTLSLAEIDFLFVDPDEGDKLTFVNFSSLPSSEEGALQLDGETVTANQQVKAADLGKLIFVPASHFFGDVTFGFSVIDTDGAASDVAVATMIVTSVNDPPTSASFNDSTLEDTPLLLNAAKFAFSVPDTDDSLKAVKFTVLPAVGTLRVGETEVTLNQLVPVASLASSSLASLHFVPPKDFFGNVTFDFRVVDSSDGESVDYRISVKVINVPDLPTAADILLTTDEDSSLAFKLADFKNAYSDGDGHALQSVTIVTLPDSVEGLLQFNPGGDGVDDLVAIAANQVITTADLDTLIFEPVTNYHGTATFTYRVTDASEQSSDGSATVTITVRSVVDDPTAMDITKTVDEDTTLTFATSDFADDAFSSPETRTLKSIKIVTLPDATHGKLTVSTTDPPTDVGAGDTVVVANLDKLKFVPVADWNGKATFTFKVTDSSDRESLAAATATITVQAVNDPPKAADFSIAANKDTALVFTGSDFTSLFSDPDGHTMKSVKIASLPGTAQGVLKLNNTDVVVNQVIALTDLGTLRFTPAAEFVGTGSFTFRVIDSTDTESTKAYTVSIVVSSNFNLPTSSAIAKSVNEDTTLTFATADFTAKFADADNHTLKSVKIATLPDETHGKLTVSTTDPPTDIEAGDTVAAADLDKLKFVPVADWNGDATFTFKVIDTSDEESADPATVTITVIAVNDPPTASNIEKSVDEDTTLTFAASDFTGVFSDEDGDTLKSVKIVTLPDAEHGTLKVGTQAATVGQTVAQADLDTVKFEPAVNWNGTASFTFKVIDSSNHESSAAATVTITVAAVDDLPTASNISKSVSEDTTLTIAASDFTSAFSDPDGHTLKSVKIVTLPDAMHGKLTDVSNTHLR